MKLKHTHKLKHQLVFSIMLPMAIAFIILGFIVSVFMHKTTEEEVTETLQSMSEQSQSSMDLLFKYASNYAIQLSHNDKIVSYLTEVNDRKSVREHELFNTVLNTLNSIGESDKNIFLAWVANENANFYLDNTNNVPDLSYDLKNRPWYETAMSNQTIAFTKPYTEWSYNKSVVSAIKTIDLSNGSNGFVVIDFDLDRITEIAEYLPLDESGEVLLIDSFGDVIYSSKSGFVSEENEISVSDELKIWLYQNNDEQENFDSLEMKGEVFYVSKETLKIPYWQMVTLVSKKEILQPVRLFLVYLSLMLLVAFIILFLIVRHIVNGKMKPVEDLKGYGQDVAQGRLDTHLSVQYKDRLDEMGELTRTYITISDVFRDKNRKLENLANQQYEAIQKQYNNILEKEKIASLATLVAGVAHEINHPIEESIWMAEQVKVKAKLCLEALINQNLSNNDFENHMAYFLKSGQNITENLNRAADLIQQFKLISSHQDLQLVDTISIYDTLEQVIKSLKPLYNTRAIDIKNELHKDVIMTTYKGPIIQVFTHLISNSLEHAFKAQESGSIRIWCEVEGALLRIYFKDDGRGIEKGILSHVFEPFYTTDTTESNSGLGLYIIHNLVNQTLSGTIKADSGRDEGSLFTISLPMVIRT